MTGTTVYEREITAIKDLYNSTNGQDWATQWNYTTIDDCALKPDCSVCSLNLYGVTCYSDQVITLGLQENNLNGTIPDSIGNFKTIKILSLYENYLTGSIPESIYSLIDLQQLLLDHNELNNSISNFIVNLTSLNWLYLYKNSLSGMIPDSICNLTSLNQVYLWGNMLSGTIPYCIGNLTNLTVLEISQNNLTGTIPTSIEKLTSLTKLYLKMNNLTGTIPQQLGRLKYLQKLDLSKNNLTGSIPSSLYLLVNLTYMALNSNFFQGTISPMIGNLNQLKYLSLATNQLSGNIPESIGNLTKVAELYLYENNLTGPICNEIGRLISLTQLKLFENNLIGTIPDSIGNLTNLTNFDAGPNNLTGSIPSSISNLVKLRMLIVGTNRLNGTIPEMANLKQLVYLSLIDNELTGTIPDSIFSLQNLTTIRLQSNQLTGTISSSIGNLKNSLTGLELSYNKLNGILPQSIGSLINLEYLMLNDNQFKSNDISTILSNLLFCDNCTNLKAFSVSNNIGIKGDLSKINTNSNTTVQQTSLEYFGASNCDLYGSLPNNIQFKNIKDFVIYNNRLSCVLPDNLIITSADDANNNLNITIVLPSNLFSKSNTFPKWMHASMFKSVESFYISKLDETVSIIIAVVAGLCLIIITIAKAFGNNQSTNINDVSMVTKNSRALTAITNTTDISDSSLLGARARKQTFTLLSQDVFVNNMKTAVTQFIKLKLMICVLVLIGIYYFNSNYFQCCLILDKLSLNYYYTNNANNNHWMDWIVVIILTMLYCILCHNVVQLHQAQVKKQHDDNCESINQASGLITFNQTKTTKILSFLTFLFAFLVANIFVIVSIIVDNLPNHNTLNIDDSQVKIMSILLPLALSINIAVIIPNFVDGCYKCIYLTRNYLSTIYITKYRPLIILFLRSVSMIIVPIISSIFLMQNCGNYWVKFWNVCNLIKHDQFNATFSYLFSSSTDATEALKEILVDSSEICNPTSLNDIQWDKCIRTFSSQWSLIVTKKLSIMVLLPFLVIAKKFVSFKLQKCVENFWCNSTKKLRSKNQNNNNESFVGLKIDLEYANLLTMLETMIVWCPISPLIAPLTLLSIYSNYFAYHHAIDSYHWSVYPFDNDVRLPIYVLCISIIFSQTYVCLFMLFCFQHAYTGWVFAIVMFSINFVFVLKYWWGM